MFNPTIHSKISLLGQVISDIKSVEAEIQQVNDPALINELTEEKNELMVELDMVGINCITIIEAYMEDCKINDLPVYLDYFRVLKQLKLADLR